MNGIPVILLMIFSAFTMNLMLQCALGLKGTAETGNNRGLTTLIKLGLIFFSVILLWVFLSKIFFNIFSGLHIYVLLFPVSYIVYEGLEFLFFRYIIKKDRKEDGYVNFPGGITAVAVFICLNIANSFFQVAVLAFGFTSGIFVVLMIIKEIRRRAALEAVPRFLRGNPLILITMGLLSLVFSVGSLLILRMINAG